jgi:hypothetical protein
MFAYVLNQIQCIPLVDLAQEEIASMKPETVYIQTLSFFFSITPLLTALLPGYQLLHHQFAHYHLLASMFP